MKFNIDKKENPNKDSYSKHDTDIAFDFSKKVVKEFGTFIKTIALFGSTARNDSNSHDIDILIVVDDVSIKLSSDITESYKIILEKIIVETSKKLHVTTLKMTNFWDYVRKGDPLGLNILRDGVALYDIGLFEPLRELLAEGRISPSKETINIYTNKAITSMFNSRNHLIRATLDLYWAVIDISHAVLMQENVLPQSPAKVAESLNDILVKNKKLEAKYITIMRKFYQVSREIIHNEKALVTGQEYDRYLKEAQIYIDRMKKILK
jgi:predicted nucleotidyltransferase/uncharacterized protein (UPF0332 family)